MSKRPGDTFAFQFTTVSSTGALANADSLPTATVVQNGTNDATPTVTVTNVSTGVYRASGTIPTGYASGDVVQVRMSATIGGVATGALFSLGVLDSLRLSDFALQGTVSDATPAVGEFDAAAGLSATDDFYNGMFLVFTSGALDGVPRKISDYVASTRTFHFTGSAGTSSAPFPVAPANGDTFIIVGRG